MHGVVSERFHKSEIENDTKYKNSQCMTFSVFIQRRGLCWFPLKFLRFQEVLRFFKCFKMKTLVNGHRVHIASIV